MSDALTDIARGEYFSQREENPVSVRRDADRVDVSLARFEEIASGAMTALILEAASTGYPDDLRGAGVPLPASLLRIDEYDRAARSIIQIPGARAGTRL